MKMGHGYTTFQTGCYFINLMVTARYDATIAQSTLSASDIERWRSSFELASKMLFEATEGQMQLGRLYFSNDAPYSAETDIHLHNTSGNSSTTLPHSTFYGRVDLREHVRNEPLVIVHELGHYVITLRDEYVVDYIGTASVRRRCQNDPSTHECPMEFARGFGLLLDNTGVPSGTQPTNIVNRFCHSNHVANFDNSQQSIHGQSCWETMAKVYENIVLPNGHPLPNELQDVEWIETNSASRYALVISSSAGFGIPAVERAIKAATKEWVYRMLVSGDQFFLTLGAAGFIGPMQNVDAEAAGKLFAAIDQSNLNASENGEVLRLATEQFPDALGAFQRLVLLAPGNSSLSIDGLDFNLPEKRLGLLTRTYGVGEIDEQLSRLSTNNKWIQHAGFPIADQEQSLYAFGLQNELIELYFSSTPGFGIVEMQLIRLPAAEARHFVPAAEGLLSFQDQPVINLEPREMGVDFPVWIEHGAEAVTFLLSQPKADEYDLTLLAPNGNDLHQAHPHSSLDVVSFDLSGNVSGRWILRVRRRRAGDSTPFCLLAAVRNRSLGTSSNVKVHGQTVRFRFLCEQKYALDCVDTSVEIYRLLPDAQAPGDVVKTITLSRERVVGSQSPQLVEVSTGWFEAETQLPPGSYIAVFRARNHGQASYASNPGGIVNGEIATFPFESIPPFSRIVRQRFQVL